MSKITLATFKAFIRKNFAQDNLWVNPLSHNVMDEGQTTYKESFKKATSINLENSNTLGLDRLWLVGSTGNYFTPYVTDEFEGIEVYNCCGSYLIAKKL